MADAGDSPRRWPALVGAALALVALASARAAWLARAAESACPTGTSAAGARCCPTGQREERGSCVGRAASCPPGFSVDETGGCVVGGGRVVVPAADWWFAVTDWDRPAGRPRAVRTLEFALDTHEVTYAAWARCARAGDCPPRPGEAGVPVTGVEPAEAELYCRFAGGRLPTTDEWLTAASLSGRRRYPWGPTGAVCRRASWGREAGPCGVGARGPELAGLFPDGATPEGLHDLAGNAAEWVREPGGHGAAGGSFRSRLAGSLRAWAIEHPSGAAPDIGFRCAYPLADAAAAR